MIEIGASASPWIVKRAAISVTLLLAACAGDAGSVEVLRAWSEDGTAHYDLSIDGVARHVARTPRPDGATVIVSDADGDVAGAAEFDGAEAFVLATDPDAVASEMPPHLDAPSMHALEVALAGELPDPLEARTDQMPLPPYDPMPLTCSGQCAANRDACIGGETSGVVVALCNWMYNYCISRCSSWGGIGSGGGVWIP